MTRDNGSDKGRRAGFTFESLLTSLPGLAGQTLSKAVGHSGNLFDALLKAPEYLEQIGKAGSYLKDMREVAGLTLDDLAKATNLDNPDILRAIEEGRSPITLDILYRLAAFYSRNDPTTFMINFSREYAPWLWQVLRVTGVEKLLITVERELKFINIYRSRESARQLSSDHFDQLLEFVRGGFDMAMDFIEPLSEDAQKTPVTPAETARATKQPGKATRPATKATTTQPNKKKAPKGTNKAQGASKARPRKAPAKKPARSQTRTTKKEG